MKPCLLISLESSWAQRTICLALLAYSFILMLIAPGIAAAEESKSLLSQASQAEDTTAAHFTRISLYVGPLQTEKVSDEIWRDGTGRWRLERHSATWDDGLVVVSDGKRIALSLPYLDEMLRVSANTNLFAGTPRSYINPDLFNANVPETSFIVSGEEKVQGRKAILITKKADEYEIRRWIDKYTNIPLREERLDKTSHPVLVTMREEMPAQKGQSYVIGSGAYVTTPQEWRHKAIITWLNAQFPHPIPLFFQLPTWLQIEWIEMQATSTGLRAMLLINAEDQLISLWIDVAVGDKPANRSLLTQGKTVVARRIGHYDITIVAASERLALRLLRAMVNFKDSVNTATGE